MRNQGKPHQICAARQASPPPHLSTNGHVDLRALSVPTSIKLLIRHGDTIGHFTSPYQALSAALMALIDAGYSDPHIARLCLLEEHGISELPREKGPAWLEQELNQARRKANSLARQAEGEPEDADELLSDTIAPPRPIVEGLLNEGMLLFGGKSKRGKSWLMLDLAVSVATGNRVWGHFDVPELQPVLYMALEDSRRRIQQRLRDIRPDVRTNGMLHLLYDFPLLSEGGLEKLRGYIESRRYRLIVIDVLARIESATRHRNDTTYLDIYRMFAPLQDLHRQHPQCLAMITHLRKADAEDIFDTLHGSVAYQGVQDALWVLERPPRGSVGVLHTCQNDGGSQTLQVSFGDGHWEFLGHHDDIQQSQERQHVRELAEDASDRGLSIPDILKGLSQPRERYQSVKQLLYRMIQDGQMMRLSRGRFGPGPRAVHDS